MMGMLSSGAGMFPSDAGILLLPLALCVYYTIAWTIVGRGPKAGPVVAQYTAPADMSPAEARYLFTGKSDYKTTSAVLAHLAAQKVISIQPEQNGYRVTRLMEELPPNFTAEEAAAFRAIQEVETFHNPMDKDHALHPQSFLLKPVRNDNYVSLIGSVIAGALMKRVQGQYFDRNLRYSMPAIAVSIIIAFVHAGSFAASGIMFLTLWFLFCGLMISLIFATNVVPLIRDAAEGRLNFSYMMAMCLPLCAFIAALIYVDSKIWKETTLAFGLSLGLLVVVHTVFSLLLSTMTARGRKCLDELLGFRQFLSTVELDRLNRLNDPRLAPTVVNDYLAYAIALDLKDAWGDHLSSALFATSTTSGA
jgi:hypothetical protein